MTVPNTFSSGVNTSFSTELNENFSYLLDRTLQRELSTVDTETLEETGEAYVLKATYTYIPNDSTDVITGVYVNCDYTHNAASTGYIKVTLDDGTTEETIKEFSVAAPGGSGSKEGGIILSNLYTGATSYDINWYQKITTAGGGYYIRSSNRQMGVYHFIPNSITDSTTISGGSV